MAYTPSLKPNTRIDVADILRGIAIAGIILIHFLEHMNFWNFSTLTIGKVDQAIWDATFFLLAGKMYAIFAMLFGLSFFIQHDNQAQKGVDFRPRFAWRMVLLMMFGLFDLLFYNGDILFIYGLCGLLVRPLIRVSNKVILTVALFLMLQPVELIYTIMAAIDPTTAALDLGSESHYLAIFGPCGSGTWLDVAKGGITHGLPANILWAIENGRMTQTVCFFLVGIYLGRKRLFYNEGNNLAIWKKILLYATIGFAVLTPLYYILPEHANGPCMEKSLTAMFNMWKNVCMMLMIISGVTLAYYNTCAKRWLIKLAPYGKMSLTNYLGQAIIGGLLFYNWGFGLWDDCAHTVSFLMGIGVIVLQFLFCTWWMKHHKRGPFEQLWYWATWLGKKAKN